jgi:hypothetical protein
MQNNQAGRLNQGNRLSRCFPGPGVDRKPTTPASHLVTMPAAAPAAWRHAAPIAAQCCCCSRFLATLSVPISRCELSVLPALLASS